VTFLTLPDIGWVLIPADTFTMGSPYDEPEREEQETLHTVTLTNDFYISKTEVTNQQYADMAQWAYDRGYCTATSYEVRDTLDGSNWLLLDLDDSDCEISFSEGTFSVDPGKEYYPVLEVNWYGAVSYCDWLSMKEGFDRAYDHSSWQCNGNDPYNAEGYRLPTEAEWEYACRAGTQTPFNTGSCLDAGNEANYDGRTPLTGCPSGLYQGSTVPVSNFSANGFGLYNMHGNASEWCNDFYGSYGGDETDPVGSPGSYYRVVRGGSCISYGAYSRSAVRHYLEMVWEGYYVSFRVCRTADVQ
jgi:formylglycine-generating enzyme required for sulfatase activity